MRRIIIAGVIIAAVLAAGIVYYTTRNDKVSGALRVSGNIELTEVELSFKTGGLLMERLVEEGQDVKKGQIIARLDSVEIAREVERQMALVAAARATLAELERGFRPEEIKEGEAAVISAKADLERIRSDFDRQQKLFAREVISAMEFEAARAAHDMAEARLKQAEERLALLREGPRIERIEVARATLKQAEATLGIAQRQMENTTILSPIDGIILSKNAEAGEFVAPGTPVVTVGDISHVWLRAYVDETDLGRVKIGQKVKVTADTYPGKVYQGHVSFIASESEFTPKSVQTQKERVKLVYRIKVEIPNLDRELKPGMPADAEILLQD
ncbi:MAG: efflux RND transporter periplasmic adaptor subunit [Acidobacteriota bacterium]